MANDAKLLIDFLIAHPGAVATVAAAAVAVGGSYVASLAAGWRAAGYLNQREIDHYKRQIDSIKDEHRRDMETLADGAIVDEYFPRIGGLKAIPVASALQFGPKAMRDRAFHVALLDGPHSGLFSGPKQVGLLDVFQEYFGSNLETNSELKEAREILLAAGGERCLLWRGNETITVKNSPILEKMFPFVIVRTVKREPKGDPTTEELINFISFTRSLDKAVANAKFEIVRLHKNPGAAYLRGYFRFDDLVVETDPLKPIKTYPEYYLLRQIFAIQTPTHVITITTGLPNEAFAADQYYEALKGWWDALRILEAEPH